jgi:hypothetical protein
MGTLTEQLDDGPVIVALLEVRVGQPQVCIAFSAATVSHFGVTPVNLIWLRNSALCLVPQRGGEGYATVVVDNGNLAIRAEEKDTLP